MPIKRFLVLIYGIAGFLIASITAFMTFLIIEEPIGVKMGSKIVLTVLTVSPVVIVLSVLIGAFFSRKIYTMSSKLHDISKGEYLIDNERQWIREFKEINDATNALRLKLGALVSSLQQRNDELSMMLMTFSHDIKTPIMIANGYLEELEDGMIARSDLPKIYAKLKSENAFINELCEDVLSYEYSKQSFGKTIHPVNVKTIATEVIALFNVPIRNDVRTSHWIHFNATDLKKVLLNLFQNAVKYSQGGAIRIYTQETTIVVEDRGVGILLPEPQKVFEPFYTIESSKNRSVSGFGLGLSIVKNLCERNHFSIVLDATFTLGARFVLSPKPCLQ